VETEFFAHVVSELIIVFVSDSYFSNVVGKAYARRLKHSMVEMARYSSKMFSF